MAGGAHICKDHKTLIDWVKDFRIKKIQMKRKVRQGAAELRVCAILATALRSAEKELRLKQQERINRWSDLQAKLVQSKSENYWSPSVSEEYKNLEEEKRKKEIAEVWKYEISSLDDFMRNLSSHKSPVESSF